jgi:hypothetical protein
MLRIAQLVLVGEKLEPHARKERDVDRQADGKTDPGLTLVTPGSLEAMG